MCNVNALFYAVVTHQDELGCAYIHPINGVLPFSGVHHPGVSHWPLSDSSPDDPYIIMESPGQAGISHMSEFLQWFYFCK